MELTIQKSFEETIQIETPKFFKSKFTGRMAKLTDAGILKVNENLIIFSKTNQDRYFVSDVIELIDPSENNEISEYEFEKLFSKVFTDLQIKAYE